MANPRTVPLVDAYAAYGGTLHPSQPLVTREALLAEMDRLEIGRALVRSFGLQNWSDTVERNRQLLAECAQQPRLVPCPYLIPAAAGDVPDEASQVDMFIRQGARAVWINPAMGCYPLADIVTDAMFRALAARRLPAICPQDVVPLTEMERLLRRHSGLRLIAQGLGYRDLRIQIPMLKTYPTFYLSLGRAFNPHKGLEYLVAGGMSGQVLFGTGFPETEPMMAITYLMYADIPEAVRRAIGGGNLERLMAEVL